MSAPSPSLLPLGQQLRGIGTGAGLPTLRVSGASHCGVNLAPFKSIVAKNVSKIFRPLPLTYLDAKALAHAFCLI